jgi:hypothetical protein
MPVRPKKVAEVSPQDKAAFWRWLANPQVTRHGQLNHDGQIEYLHAGARSIANWRRVLRKCPPYKAEQVLFAAAPNIASLGVLGSVTREFAIGPQHIGLCLQEVRKDLIEEWCEFVEQNGTDPDGPESKRSPEFRMFSILVREGLEALHPQKSIARAVTVLAHQLAQDHHYQPHAVINDIIMWARTNTPVSSGEEAALRSMCRKIWNSHLHPAPATVAMMNKVLHVCPNTGVRSPKKNLLLRRVTCLNLLRWLRAQVLAWRDGIVDIPSDWFSHPSGDRRGVSSANYKRLLMDPLIECGILVLHQKHSRPRSQAAQYRLYLAGRGGLARIVPAAEELLAKPDGMIINKLRTL